MNLEEYFAELCTRMGWEPTPWRIAVFKEWARMEGITIGIGRARLDFHWNPLATTWEGRRASTDIGYGPGKWNNANPPLGVGIYADAEAGIEATAATLNFGDFYKNIKRCFADQRGYQEAIGPKDFTSWVGHNVYGAAVVNFMNRTEASKEMSTTGSEPPSGAPGGLEALLAVQRMNQVLQARFRLVRLAFEANAEVVEDAVATLEKGGILE